MSIKEAIVSTEKSALAVDFSMLRFHSEDHPNELGGIAMYDVMGLGTLAMDILIKVDLLPVEDSFCVIEKKDYMPGGSATNVIVQLARSGARCGFIGKIGDDAIGREISKSLVDEGIDVGWMRIKPNGITLHTEIVVDHKGRKFIMLDMGDSFLTLDQSEIADEAIRSAKVFYTDLVPSCSVQVLKQANDLKKIVVCNMQVGLKTMEGFGISKPDILDLIRFVDVFTINQVHLAELTGFDELNESVKLLRSLTNGLIIVTRGSAGSTAIDSSGDLVNVEACPVDVIDTTGAGDSYIGSFIYQYFLLKRSLVESMRYASVCAAYNCIGKGARHMPNHAQTRAFAAERQYSLELK